MAGTSLLTLIDDIATLLDDIAVMSKVAAKKTAGVLGDDLALNAQQVTGVSADRELPVVWAVAKGSLKNKAILVPAAILISLFMPWAITPLLMVGGAFLCFEGAEKLMHKILHKTDGKEARNRADEHIPTESSADLHGYEQQKIKGAIRTDFILSAEIIVISLGTVAEASIGMQITVLVIIALAMTVGVYGLVGGLVKVDDLGLHLLRTSNERKFRAWLGRVLVASAPKIMKFLSVAGTAAMFMVGGGILVHGVPVVHHLFEHWQETVGHGAAWYRWLSAILPTLLNALTGVIAGAVLVAVVEVFGQLKKRSTDNNA